MVQTRPHRPMSTPVTPSGSCIVLGKQTACVVFVMTADPRSMTHLLRAPQARQGAYTVAIHPCRHQPAEHSHASVARLPGCQLRLKCGDLSA